MPAILRALFDWLERTFGRARVIDVNLILVAEDAFTPAERQELQGALQITRDIFDDVRLRIRNVLFWAITSQQAGPLAVIDSGAEARKLTHDWTVPNNFIDVFVVRSMTNADGRSPVGGPCNKDAKSMNGVVTSLNGSTANSGNTMAHEIGHYLGLDHIGDNGNFIGGNGASNSFTGIFPWQGWIMKQHCFVRNP